MIDVTKHLRLVWKIIRKYGYKPPAGMDEDDLFQIGCIGLIKAAEKFDPARGCEFSTLASRWIRSELSNLYQGVNAEKRIAVTIDIDTKMKGTSATLSNIIPDESLMDPDDVVYAKETVAMLTKKEPVIIPLLMKGYRKVEIAKIMGLSQERIGQRVRKLRRVVG